MRYSKEEKAKWLEDWRRSGKSIIAFTKENGLVRWTFTKWLKEERSSKQGFVEVPARGVQPEQIIPHIVIEKGGLKIHIPLWNGWGELRAIMEALGAAL